MKLLKSLDEAILELERIKAEQMRKSMCCFQVWTDCEFRLMLIL